MRVLDLFSGVGGFSLGLERAGMETVAFCEIDPFCRGVLRKHWPDVPIYEDVRELSGKEFNDRIDVVAGGFPCQPFSTSGQRLGAGDDRHLWPEMLRVIREVQPGWVIGENVAGFISMELDQALFDLEENGYSTGAFVIPACATGSPTRRDRVWILAHSERIRLKGPGGCVEYVYPKEDAYREAIGIVDAFQGDTLPYVCGRHDGVPSKLDEDRLNALGNAVVPQIPEIIGRAIMEVSA